MHRSRPYSTPREPHLSCAGFTLLEMMVTLIVVALITTLGIPAMRDFLVTQRMKTTSFDIASTLMMARSEAIKRRGDITIEAKTGGWTKGWEVKSGSTVVREQGELNSDVAIAVEDDGGSVTTLTYRKDGRMPFGSTAIVFSITPSTGETRVEERCITLDTSGRPNANHGSDCP